MKTYTLAEKESKFADIIWKNAPLSSKELTEICELELSWKRTTTYTVLKKLCDRGIFANENGTVVAKISHEDFLAKQGEQYINQSFGGSLPKFLVAFSKGKKLSDKDISQLQKLIDENEED